MSSKGSFLSDVQPEVAILILKAFVEFANGAGGKCHFGSEPFADHQVDGLGGGQLGLNSSLEKLTLDAARNCHPLLMEGAVDLKEHHVGVAECREAYCWRMFCER